VNFGDELAMNEETDGGFMVLETARVTNNQEQVMIGYLRYLQNK
jgi:hypothetical protein